MGRAGRRADGGNRRAAEVAHEEDKIADILKLLESMENVVRKLPEDVRIARLFLVDDGQGIILERGIHAAAEALGKPVETAEWAGKLNWEVLEVHVGTLTICQINSLNKGEKS